MTLKIYTIYDSKTLTYSHPHFILNKGSFSRAILETLNDTSSPFSKYPADFTAFEIGEWDDATGNLKMYPAKVNLGCILEWASAKPAHDAKLQQANA